MALTFREQLQADLATMMDQAVFGLTISVDGEALQCAEQSDHGVPYASRSQDIPGLNTSTRKLIFRAPDMPQVPVIGQRVDLDGEDWYVADRAQPLGHIILEFRREDS